MKLHRSREIRPQMLVACLIVASMLVASAQAVPLVTAPAASGPVYVPNEYIVKVVPGSTRSAVAASLEMIHATLVDRPLFLPDMYLARLSSTGGGFARSVSSVRSTNAPWVILNMYPNIIRHVMAIPNDPYFGKQWDMGLINMPQAWAMQKGSGAVTVAVIDTGVGNHPDLEGRILTTGYDFAENDPDPSNDGYGHGTHVAGTIAAQGDNDIGISGVCWNGVNILPIRIFDDTGATDSTKVLAGLDWALQHKADVVNMSYGGPPGVADPVEQAKIKELANAGIILCASAGNDGLSTPPSVSAPALYPEVIAVSSVGPNDEFSYFSSYGPGNEVDIAAPGGDDLLGPDALVLSTMVTWNNNLPIFDYAYEEGTSMACPHVVGAAALLLSQGVSSAEVRSRLETSARKPRTGKMDPRKYGAGILDMAAALSNGSISLVKPIKGSTVSSTPDFKINVRGLALDSIAVYLDYPQTNGVPDNISIETPVLSGKPAGAYLNPTHTSLSFNWSDVSATPLASGFHFAYVSAQTTGGDTVSDWGTFSVATKIIPAGTYLIALPYASAVDPLDGLRKPLPSNLLLDSGTSQPLDFRATSPDPAKLVRYDAPDMTYLYYATGANNLPVVNGQPWGNLYSPRFDVPTGGGFLSGDLSALQFPAGSGFWLILHQDAVVNPAYTEIEAQAGFDIALYKGWNLIGNPFTHPIPLSSIRFVYGGKTRTLDEDGQSPNPWVQPLFYGYSTTGIPGYLVVDRTRGVLQPYQGYWLRALVGGKTAQDRLLMMVQ